MHYITRYWTWLKVEKLLPILIGVFLLRIVLTPVGIFVQNKIGQYDSDWNIVPQKIDHNLTAQISEAWMSWDSGWYLHIAKDGYLSKGAPFEESMNHDIVFYPGYPLTMNVVHKLGIPIELTGLIISSIATVMIVSYGYLLLISRGVKSQTARLALILLFVHPMAFIFGAVLSEAFFLAFALACLYAWHRQKLAIFWAVGIIAGAYRPIGILLCVPGFIQMLEQRFWISPVSKWLKQGIALTGPIIGFGAFLLYTRHLTGVWDSFSKAEAVFWDRHQSIGNILPNLFIKPFAGINWLFFAFFAWATIILVLKYHKKIGTDLTIWSLLMLVGPLTTMLIGMPRYTTTIFPLAWAVAYLIEPYKMLRKFTIVSLVLSQFILYVLWVMNAQVLQ